MSDSFFKLPVVQQCRHEAARMDKQYSDNQAWAVFIRAADHIEQLQARIEGLEKEINKTLVGWQETVSRVAAKERPAYDEQQQWIAKLESENMKMRETLRHIFTGTKMLTETEGGE